MIPLGAGGSQSIMNGRKATVPGVKAGVDSGCLFCLARTAPLPEVGARIQILTDYRAGLMGRVVETPPSLPLRKGELLVQFDHEPSRIQHTVSLERDLIGVNSEVPTPIWAPPISLREAAELDDVIVKFCERGFSAKIWKPHLPTFYEVIRRVWHNRLPLEGTDIWSILEAHGVPQKYKKRLTELYQDGRDLLVYAIGRKPIKKKRVAPFSPEPPGHWEWDPEVLSGSR
jgi:hypothetical protein